jgi:hypothetical protein
MEVGELERVVVEVFHVTVRSRTEVGANALSAEPRPRCEREKLDTCTLVPPPYIPSAVISLRNARYAATQPVCLNRLHSNFAEYQVPMTTRQLSVAPPKESK